MNYKVKSISVFEKQAKWLVKKYVSLKGELLSLVQLLKENPEQGTAIGRSCFKIRIAVSSKGKGKSGGARVITNIVISDKTNATNSFVTRKLKAQDPHSHGN